ncbi:hypothetical protein [Carboxylicivirga marina]|uniref:Uncharacterized protein n=1 Tax=Carboxylicivirga marina TaxID=2800988 RepID=A0ABS1HLB3_9BACT|nr:hypothetical protein [Carboxylicivirga marina]MBK3518469.1 hypothetical protein [Carboxylicivirga marina]
MRYLLLIYILCITVTSCQSSEDVKRPEIKKEFTHEALEAKMPFPQELKDSHCIGPNHVIQSV